MLHLKWDQITVLVVDDNSFMRKLLVTTLNTFGVKNIVQNADGIRAIKRLKLSGTDPVKAGLGQVDLIISDYNMPGLDGILFLRWLRTGEGAPNRFVPFIMVSGLASWDVVSEARDAGVSGVVAKPFSVKSLADNILSVVNANRQFVLAQGYFGPDRRHKLMVVADERRRTKPDQIQTVKPDTVTRTLREDVRAIYFKPDSSLRIKLGPEALRQPVEFDPAVIRAAEKRIESLVGDYAVWVEKYFDSMDASLDALEPSDISVPENRKHIANIHKIAKELHDQGGTFDYQLITEFGMSLFHATEDPSMTITENTCKLIEAHIDAMRTVFKNRIQGYGGDVGAQLLSETKRAVEKYT